MSSTNTITSTVRAYMPTLATLRDYIARSPFADPDATLFDCTGIPALTTMVTSDRFRAMGTQTLHSVMQVPVSVYNTVDDGITESLTDAYTASEPIRNLYTTYAQPVVSRAAAEITSRTAPLYNTYVQPTVEDTRNRLKAQQQALVQSATNFYNSSRRTVVETTTNLYNRLPTAELIANYTDPTAYALSLGSRVFTPEVNNQISSVATKTMQYAGYPFRVFDQTFPRASHYIQRAYSGLADPAGTISSLYFGDIKKPSNIVTTAPVSTVSETTTQTNTTPSAPIVLKPKVKFTFWQKFKNFFKSFGEGMKAFFRWAFGKKTHKPGQSYKPVIYVAPKTVAEIQQKPGFPLETWQKDRIAFIMTILGNSGYLEPLIYAGTCRSFGTEIDSVHPLTFLWFILKTKTYQFSEKFPADLKEKKDTIAIDDLVKTLYAKRHGVIDQKFWNNFLFGEGNKPGIVEKFERSKDQVKPLIDKFAKELNVDPKYLKGFLGSKQEIKDVISALFGKTTGEIELNPYPVK